MDSDLNEELIIKIQEFLKKDVNKFHDERFNCNLFLMEKIPKLSREKVKKKYLSENEAFLRKIY